jgi:DNA excision repair protein ERCC-4
MPKKPLRPPWQLVVDTREQLPYSYEGATIGAGESRRKLDLVVVHRALKQGDYSIAGMESRVAIERKSKSDLYNTVGGSRSRFTRELARLNALEHAAVVIECEWLDMMQQPPESLLTPSSLNGSIIAWQQRFPRVHWWWLPGRAVAAKMVYKILDRFYTDNKD